MRDRATEREATQMTQNGAEDFQALHEIVQAAHAALDRNLWDYVAGAAGTETTQLRNRQALDRIAFRPRVLRDVSRVDATATFLGRKVRLPVALAPVGGLESIGAGGGVTVARGAGLAGVPFFLSSVTQSGMERVAEAAGGPKVFQLYTRGDADWTDAQLRRAAECGYDALCLTVDSALYSRRERDIANRFAKPWRSGASGGMAYQAALNWDDVRRIRDRHRLPLMLKGIATEEDADIACRAGIDVVYVSNHGGRQLDHGLGAIEVLPGIVRTVAGRAQVFVDGGFCRGTDIVKAVALGAATVGIGRLMCCGLAAAGAEGIARVIALLEEEVVECLGLLGLDGWSGLNAGHLAPAEPVVPPGAFSAFPLLRLKPRPS
jgi:isopentenyl diphosphate isomerase/L-lactate dehydrogenase-like FMN-dependent dehydrogenase